MITVVEYEDETGRYPFSNWFSGLNVQAALKIRTAISRMENGNFSNVKSVGEGVHEYRLNFGPGYRVYFGRDGEKLVILLGGGSKRRQGKDIEIARLHWKATNCEKGKNYTDGTHTRF